MAIRDHLRDTTNTIQPSAPTPYTTGTVLELISGTLYRVQVGDEILPMRSAGNNTIEAGTTVSVMYAGGDYPWCCDEDAGYRSLVPVALSDFFRTKPASAWMLYILQNNPRNYIYREGVKIGHPDTYEMTVQGLEGDTVTLPVEYAGEDVPAASLPSGTPVLCYNKPEYGWVVIGCPIQLPTISITSIGVVLYNYVNPHYGTGANGVMLKDGTWYFTTTGNTSANVVAALSEASAEDAEITLVVSGTAVAPDDYWYTGMDRKTIAAGDLTTTGVIAVTDTAKDSEGTVTVTLENPEGCTLGTPTEVTYTIKHLDYADAYFRAVGAPSPAPVPSDYAPYPTVTYAKAYGGTYIAVVLDCVIQRTLPGKKVRCYVSTIPGGGLYWELDAVAGDYQYYGTMLGYGDWAKLAIEDA